MKQNIFDWLSEQLKTEQNFYKGPIEAERQKYNIKCLEIIAEAIKIYPDWTFRQIITNFGLLDGNLHEESNVTLGHLRRHKKQYEETISRWTELGIADGLKG